MTFSTRPLARVSIACAATALALSACSSKGPTEDPTTPTPSVSASATASVEATPAPGEWTLEDLKVGTKVPKEDLERLFPKWEVPEPPATLTEFSEQGATDAALYFDEVLDFALNERSAKLINSIDNEDCANCSELRKIVEGQENAHWRMSRTRVKGRKVSQDPKGSNMYAIEISRETDVMVAFDPAGLIEQALSNQDTTTSTVVAFMENQWVPIVIKMKDFSWPSSD